MTSWAFDSYCLVASEQLRHERIMLRLGLGEPSRFAYLSPIPAIIDPAIRAEERHPPWRSRRISSSEAREGAAT